MGRIYAEAELVIVAAAGSSSLYGLPGVSTRPRQAQRRVELDTNVELIITTGPDTTLTRSTWASRGWTHQEGYLATRRLVFTDYEVLYICDVGVYQESVQRPGIYRKNMFAGFPKDISEYRVSNFLVNYSTRKLSSESDILDACIGVLGKLVDYHFWGIVAVPISSSSTSRRLPLSLRWYNQHPCSRRGGFPTWSWIATTGPKQLSSPYNFHDRNFAAEILTTDGLWMTAERPVQSRYDTLPPGYGPTLRLTASFYTASLITRLYEKPLVVFPQAGVIGDDTGIAFVLYLDTKLLDSVPLRTVKALHLESDMSINGKWSCRESLSFVIFQPVGAHYRRIGLAFSACSILKKASSCVDDTSFSSGEVTGLENKIVSQYVTPHPDCRSDGEVIYVE